MQPEDTPFVDAVWRLTDIGVRRQALEDMLLGEPVTEPVNFATGSSELPYPGSLGRTLSEAYRELQDEAIRELEHISSLVCLDGAAILAALETAGAGWLILTLMERVAVAEGGGPA
jgi:hypothetical protein